MNQQPKTTSLTVQQPLFSATALPLLRGHPCGELTRRRAEDLEVDCLVIALGSFDSFGLPEPFSSVGLCQQSFVLR